MLNLHIFPVLNIYCTELYLGPLQRSYPGLQITAGQRTMSGLIADLTGQTPVLPVILTGHFWIQTLYFPYSCHLMLYNAAMISFFFGVFCCFALNPSKKKNAAIN